MWPSPFWSPTPYGQPWGGYGPGFLAFGQQQPQQQAPQGISSNELDRLLDLLERAAGRVPALPPSFAGCSPYVGCPPRIAGCYPPSFGRGSGSAATRQGPTGLSSPGASALGRNNWGLAVPHPAPAGHDPRMYSVPPPAPAPMTAPGFQSSWNGQPGGVVVSPGAPAGAHGGGFDGGRTPFAHPYFGPGGHRPMLPTRPAQPFHPPQPAHPFQPAQPPSSSHIHPSHAPRVHPHILKQWSLAWSGEPFFAYGCWWVLTPYGWTCYVDFPSWL